MVDKTKDQVDEDQDSEQGSEDENNENENASDKEKEPEAPLTFPRMVGDREFQTPEELQEHVKQLKELAKAGTEILKKAGKTSKAPSQKKVLSEMVAAVLNENMTDELKAKVSGIEEDSRIAVIFLKESGTFAYPTPKAREGGTSGGPRGGRTLVVDGKEYPSAKNARDTLHPEESAKQQNRKTIINFLRKDGKHTIDKDQE